MRHHPEFSWLEQYAAATLPAPIALCVATHVSFCAECRRQVGLLQSLGGLLLSQLEPIPVTDDLLQRVLMHIEDLPSNDLPSNDLPGNDLPRNALPSAIVSSAVASIADTAFAQTENADVIPKPLRKLIGGEYDCLAWSRILPSLHEASLLSGDVGYRVALHRIKPGGKVPHHDHRSEEFTVVLRGSFSDEYGVYSDGDFILRGPGEQHLPLAARNEECICLTVQQAPVRFTGMLWRCLNPLLR
jgi:putative transcriptional regulator